ncbi:MAG: DNA repair protein RecN [Treponema sp.]|jgi:DNA repair protein RecN (Recombination protein N)|nr:DNA repair protein RecN [Treponema sp.]
MLEELGIRNYALIENVSLSFGGGFNVLTGETGAGKSIIVGSLSFLLGAKADAEVIRTGTEEAGVSAVISVDGKNAEAREWLSGRDIEPEDGSVIVRRSFKQSGRGSIYIQNVPVTRNDLADFMSLLFDLHGQHNHETLLRRENHRRYLDRFAGIEGDAAAFNAVFLELADKKKALETSLGSERDRAARLEILHYGVDEIGKAAPKPGESRELEAEAQRLSSFEKLAGQVNGAAESLFDGEYTVLSLARRARNSLDSAAAIDPGLAALQKRMEDLYYEAEDLGEEFRSYRDSLVYDPSRLEQVEERLALLYRLGKKYAAPGPAGGTVGAGRVTGEEGILAWKAAAEAEIEALSGAGENRDRLKAEIAALEKDIAARAAVLSRRRKAAAVELGKGITEILSKLGMPQARFSAEVFPKTRSQEGAEPPGSRSPGKPEGQGLVCGPWGADEVEFLISANAGEPLKDLSRIASGGELSRVMLAIKTVLSGADNLETLVFDEIDTGIGGEVALAVGEYLKKMGARKQIFCVTHLASIAVRADNHLKVEKRTGGGRTFTGVTELDREGRRQEIARMLAGDSGKAALAHADDLLLKYGRKET